MGGLGALGAALASSLASNAFQGDRAQHAQQGYPPQDSGMLGSILGALGKQCLWLIHSFISYITYIEFQLLKT